jgi:hypothetical protein
MHDSSLGNHVNAFVRTIAAVGLAAAMGCALSPEQRMVGIYSLDPIRSKIPRSEAPGINRNIRDATRNTKLKLHSDHRFVLTGVRTVEGTWRSEGDLLYLRPDPQETPHLLFFNQEEVRLRVGSDYGLLFDLDTPVGNLKVQFRKTG